MKIKIVVQNKMKQNYSVPSKK